MPRNTSSPPSSRPSSRPRLVVAMVRMLMPLYRARLRAGRWLRRGRSFILAAHAQSRGSSMTPPRATARTHPHTVTLRDGTPVTFRLMTAADAGRIGAFARSLPEDDLLFLRMDITDPGAVALWVRNLEA